MSEIGKYLPQDILEPNEYSKRLWRGGLSELPPAIITCAITGGNAGKEVNPNLPETLEEQVQACVEAYEAGASMVHIHRRSPENPCQVTMKPEEYIEINRLVREKCPDIIINNNCTGGRMRTSDTTLGDLRMTSVTAGPEVASLDTSNYCSKIRLPKREPPLFGRDEETWKHNYYSITDDEAMYVAGEMIKNGTKPEFECFSIADFHYVNRMTKMGYKDPYGGPHLVQYVFTPGSGWPTSQYLDMLVSALPRDCVLGIIATGAQQWSILAQALCKGLHVRVGMEDNLYIERGRLAKSNGELVEKIVRIAKELGRPVATPAQAREMLGLPATPKTW